MRLERVFGEGIYSFQTSVDSENTEFVGLDLKVGVLAPKKGYGDSILLRNQEVDEFMASFLDNGVRNRNDIHNLGGQCVYVYYRGKDLVGIKRAGACLERQMIHTGKD